MPQPYVEYVVIELRVAAHLDSHIVLAPPFEKARRVHSSMVSDSMQSRAVSHAIAQQSKHCTRRGECCTHRILWMATSKNSSSTSAVSVRPHGVCQYSHCDTTDRTLPSTWSLPLASIVSDNTYVPSSHSNPQQNNCAWCGVQTSPRRVSRGREKITFAKSPRRHLCWFVATCTVLQPSYCHRCSCRCSAGRSSARG